MDCEEKAWRWLPTANRSQVWARCRRQMPDQLNFCKESWRSQKNTRDQNNFGDSTNGDDRLRKHSFEFLKTISNRQFRTYYTASEQAHLLWTCVEDFLVLGLRLSDPCRRIVAAKCPDPEWTIEALVVLLGELDFALRLFLQNQNKKYFSIENKIRITENGKK